MDTQVKTEWAASPILDGMPPSFCVWTSMLRRAIQTAEDFDPQLYDIKVEASRPGARPCCVRR
jgi:hypothetical protein